MSCLPPIPEKRPLKKPKIGPPDIYPQDVKQKEDELSTVSVKQGYFENYPYLEEYGSCKSIRVIKDSIGVSFGNILKRKKELNTLVVDTKKKPAMNMRDIFWPATIRSKTSIDAWFKDLNANKPLSLLIKKVPIFNKREDLLAHLFEYKVTWIRACWVIKLHAAHANLVAENKLKKKQINDPSLEWTVMFCRILRELLERINNLLQFSRNSACDDLSGAGKPLSFNNNNSTTSLSYNTNATNNVASNLMSSGGLFDNLFNSPSLNTAANTGSAPTGITTYANLADTLFDSANSPNSPPWYLTQDLTNSLTIWRYLESLVWYLYKEKLLDVQEMATFVCELLEKSIDVKPKNQPILKDDLLDIILPFAIKYVETISSSYFLARRLSYFCSVLLYIYTQQAIYDLKEAVNHQCQQSFRIDDPNAFDYNAKRVFESMLRETPVSTLLVQNYHDCPRHRYIILTLSDMLSILCLKCPTAFVWNGFHKWSISLNSFTPPIQIHNPLNESVTNQFTSPFPISQPKTMGISDTACYRNAGWLWASVLDVVPIPPSMLPRLSYTGYSVVDCLQDNEHLISQRSCAVEDLWPYKRNKTIMLGHLLTQIIDILHALDNYDYCKCDKDDNFLKSLQTKLYQQPNEIYEREIVLNVPLLLKVEKSIVFTLCQWAITSQRHGSHRLLVISYLLAERINYIADLIYGQNIGDMAQSNESLESGCILDHEDDLAMYNSSRTVAKDLFQNILFQYLDKYAPTITDNCSDTLEHFTNLMLLYGKLIEYHVFNYEAYVQLLLCRGRIDVCKLQKPVWITHMTSAAWKKMKESKNIYDSLLTEERNGSLPNNDDSEERILEQPEIIYPFSNVGFITMRLEQPDDCRHYQYLYHMPLLKHSHVYDKNHSNIPNNDNNTTLLGYGIKKGEENVFKPNNECAEYVRRCEDLRNNALFGISGGHIRKIIMQSKHITEKRIRKLWDNNLININENNETPTNQLDKTKEMSNQDLMELAFLHQHIHTFPLNERYGLWFETFARLIVRILRSFACQKSNQLPNLSIVSYVLSTLSSLPTGTSCEPGQLFQLINSILIYLPTIYERLCQLMANVLFISEQTIMAPLTSSSKSSKNVSHRLVHQSHLLSQDDLTNNLANKHHPIPNYWQYYTIELCAVCCGAMRPHFSYLVASMQTPNLYKAFPQPVDIMDEGDDFRFIMIQVSCSTIFWSLFTFIKQIGEVPQGSSSVIRSIYNFFYDVWISCAGCLKKCFKSLTHEEMVNLNSLTRFDLNGKIIKPFLPFPILSATSDNVPQQTNNSNNLANMIGTVLVPLITEIKRTMYCIISPSPPPPSPIHHPNTAAAWWDPNFMISYLNRWVNYVPLNNNEKSLSTKMDNNLGLLNILSSLERDKSLASLFLQLDAHASKRYSFVCNAILTILTRILKGVQKSLFVAKTGEIDSTNSQSINFEEAYTQHYNILFGIRYLIKFCVEVTCSYQHPKISNTDYYNAVIHNMGPSSQPFPLNRCELNLYQKLFLYRSTHNDAQQNTNNTTVIHDTFPLAHGLNGPTNNPPLLNGEWLGAFKALCCPTHHMHHQHSQVQHPNDPQSLTHTIASASANYPFSSSTFLQALNNNNNNTSINSVGLLTANFVTVSRNLIRTMSEAGRLDKLMLVYDSLAVLCLSLILSHIFSLEDFIKHVALPSLLAAACPPGGTTSSMNSNASANSNMSNNEDTNNYIDGTSCDLKSPLFSPDGSSLSSSINSPSSGSKARLSNNNNTLDGSKKTGLSSVKKRYIRFNRSLKEKPAEAGARLTCYLLYRLFKSFQNVPLSKKINLPFNGMNSSSPTIKNYMHNPNAIMKDYRLLNLNDYIISTYMNELKAKTLQTSVNTTNTDEVQKEFYYQGDEIFPNHPPKTESNADRKPNVNFFKQMRYINVTQAFDNIIEKDKACTNKVSEMPMYSFSDLIQDSKDIQNLLFYQHNISIGALLAVFKALILTSSQDSLTNAETKSLKQQKSNADDDYEFIGTMLSLRFGKFSQEILHVLTDQGWVKELFLKDPNGICSDQLLLDPLLSHKQASKLLHLICYPHGFISLNYPQHILANHLSSAGSTTPIMHQIKKIARILSTLDLWSLRISYLELALTLKQQTREMDINTLYELIAKITVQIFQCESQFISTSDNNPIEYKPSLVIDALFQIISHRIANINQSHIFGGTPTIMLHGSSKGSTNRGKKLKASLMKNNTLGGASFTSGKRKKRGRPPTTAFVKTSGKNKRSPKTLFSPFGNEVCGNAFMHSHWDRGDNAKDDLSDDDSPFKAEYEDGTILEDTEGENFSGHPNYPVTPLGISTYMANTSDDDETIMQFTTNINSPFTITAGCTKQTQLNASSHYGKLSLSEFTIQHLRKSHQQLSVWLIAPFIARLALGIRTRIIRVAAQALESGSSWSTAGTGSTTKLDRERNAQRSASLLNHQPFYLLVKVCLTPNKFFFSTANHSTSSNVYNDNINSIINGGDDGDFALNNMAVNQDNQLVGNQFLGTETPLEPMYTYDVRQQDMRELELQQQQTHLQLIDYRYLLVSALHTQIGAILKTSQEDKNVLALPENALSRRELRSSLFMRLNLVADMFDVLLRGYVQSIIQPNTTSNLSSMNNASTILNQNSMGSSMGSSNTTLMNSPINSGMYSNMSNMTVTQTPFQTGQSQPLNTFSSTPTIAPFTVNQMAIDWCILLIQCLTNDILTLGGKISNSMDDDIDDDVMNTVGGAEYFESLQSRTDDDLESENSQNLLNYCGGPLEKVQRLFQEYLTLPSFNNHESCTTLFYTLFDMLATLLSGSLYNFSVKANRFHITNMTNDNNSNSLITTKRLDDGKYKIIGLKSTAKYVIQERINEIIQNRDGTSMVSLFLPVEECQKKSYHLICKKIKKELLEKLDRDKLEIVKSLFPLQKPYEKIIISDHVPYPNTEKEQENSIGLKAIDSVYINPWDMIEGIPKSMGGGTPFNMASTWWQYLKVSSDNLLCSALATNPQMHPLASVREYESMALHSHQIEDSTQNTSFLASLPSYQPDVDTTLSKGPQFHLLSDPCDTFYLGPIEGLPDEDIVCDDFDQIPPQSMAGRPIEENKLITSPTYNRESINIKTPGSVLAVSSMISPPNKMGNFTPYEQQSQYSNMSAEERITVDLNAVLTNVGTPKHFKQENPNLIQSNEFEENRLRGLEAMVGGLPNPSGPFIRDRLQPNVNIANYTMDMMHNNNNNNNLSNTNFQNMSQSKAQQHPMMIGSSNISQHTNEKMNINNPPTSSTPAKNAQAAGPKKPKQTRRKRQPKTTQPSTTTSNAVTRPKTSQTNVNPQQASQIPNLSRQGPESHLNMMPQQGRPNPQMSNFGNNPNQMNYPPYANEMGLNKFGGAMRPQNPMSMASVGGYPTSSGFMRTDYNQSNQQQQYGSKAALSSMLRAKNPINSTDIEKHTKTKKSSDNIHTNTSSAYDHFDFDNEERAFKSTHKNPLQSNLQPDNTANPSGINPGTKRKYGLIHPPNVSNETYQTPAGRLNNNNNNNNNPMYQSSSNNNLFNNNNNSNFNSGPFMSNNTASSSNRPPPPQYPLSSSLSSQHHHSMSATTNCFNPQNNFQQHSNYPMPNNTYSINSNINQTPTSSVYGNNMNNNNNFISNHPQGVMNSSSLPRGPVSYYNESMNNTVPHQPNSMMQMHNNRAPPLYGAPPLSSRPPYNPPQGLNARFGSDTNNPYSMQAMYQQQQHPQNKPPQY